MASSNSTCLIPQCERAPRARGKCHMHYEQWRRPLGRPLIKPFFLRFTEKVSKTASCWHWTGAKYWNGYGVIRSPRGRNEPAHRIAYEIYKGPIPDGFQIDHLCKTVDCVNPRHLEAVTPKENWRRSSHWTVEAYLSNKCRKGHLRTPANTWVSPTTGVRRCRACDRARNKQYRLVKVARG